MRPSGSQAGRARRPLDRGQVDVRRQVLPPDRDERIGVDAMAVVGAERAAASRPCRARRPGSRSRSGARSPRSSGAPAARDPVVDREADLRRLARARASRPPRRDVPRGRASTAAPSTVVNGRRARAAAAARASVDEPLDERAVRGALDPVDRAGHRAARWRPPRRAPGVVVGRLEVVGQACVGEPGGERVEPRRRDVDRLVADRVEEWRAGPAQAVEDAGRERARTRRRARGRRTAPAARARSHTDSRCRAIAQPKIGWPSGAVRKSPSAARARSAPLV